MEVKGYFPIPIWKEQIKVEKKFKKHVFNYIENNKMLSNRSSPKLSHSQSLKSLNSNINNKNSNFEENNILDKPGFDKIKTEIKKILKNCFIEYLGDNQKENEVVLRESWINNCDKGGSQFAHNHGNSILSYTYYINYDFKKGHAPLFFERPNFNSSPFFSLLSWTKWTSSRNILFEIMEGDILIWPSYLQHGYFENKGDSRISISGNALLKEISNSGYSFQIKS